MDESTDLRLGAVYLLALVFAVCGCGGSAGSGDGGATDAPLSSQALDGGAGPDGVPTLCTTVPATCPSPAPSYEQDIAPILDGKCNTCHAAADSGLWPLINYDDVRDWQTLVLSDVEYCTMPPAGAPQLTTSEQFILLSWVVCGAPEYGSQTSGTDASDDSNWP
jgi:hypothetical protein